MSFSAESFEDIRKAESAQTALLDKIFAFRREGRYSEAALLTREFDRTGQEIEHERQRLLLANRLTGASYGMVRGV